MLAHPRESVHRGHFSDCWPGHIGLPSDPSLWIPEEEVQDRRRGQRSACPGLLEPFLGLMGLHSPRCSPTSMSIMFLGLILWKPHLRAFGSFRICLPHLPTSPTPQLSGHSLLQLSRLP